MVPGAIVVPGAMVVGAAVPALSASVATGARVVALVIVVIAARGEGSDEQQWQNVGVTAHGGS